eukprot:scaffold978_cov134-Skeletonema_marinoi.AAC.17
MMSSEHPCIAVANGDFIDCHKGKKSHVSTRTAHLFASLLFAVVFLLFSRFISSNGILLSEISRLNQELDSFEKLKERMTDDELKLVLSCQQMNQLERKIERGNFVKLDWSQQQLNETEIKMDRDEGTLQEISKIEQKLRDVMSELDLSLEKMLRGADIDSFSGVGHI